MRNIDRAVQKIHAGTTDKRGYETVRRTIVNLERRVELLQLTLIHHRDAMSQRHRFGLVVRDIDRCRGQLLLQMFQFAAHLQRNLARDSTALVHEKGARMHAGPSQSDLAVHRWRVPGFPLQKWFDL